DFLNGFDLQRFGATFNDVSLAVNGDTLAISIAGADGKTHEVDVPNYASMTGLSLTAADPTGAAISGGDGSKLWFAANGVNSTFVGGTGNSVLIGGTGNDLISVAGGNNLIFGGDGDDTLAGGSGNDALVGGAGNDTLIAGSGADTLDPGTGM